jgi:hypothetical protein
MHHLPRFCMPGPHAYCTRTTSIRPVWIGVRQLAVQLVRVPPLTFRLVTWQRISFSAT